MTQPTVTDALAELKAAFLTITPPAGVSLGSRVWAWPADRASVSYATKPFIICAQVLNRDDAWQPESQGVGVYSWMAEVLICLQDETPLDAVNVESEEDAQEWLLAAARVVFNNRGLGGAARDFGANEALFTTRTGNMGWLGPETVFWGVRCSILVHQHLSLPSL